MRLHYIIQFIYQLFYSKIFQQVVSPVVVYIMLCCNNTNNNKWRSTHTNKILQANIHTYFMTPTPDTVTDGEKKKFQNTQRHYITLHYNNLLYIYTYIQAIFLLVYVFFFSSPTFSWQKLINKKKTRKRRQMN